MIKRFALLFLGITLATACSAQSGGDTKPAYIEGTNYVTLPQPKRLSGDGKVEVVEVFSYGCIHCAHFAADAEKLRKSLPKGVTFKLLPASFSPAWEPYARAFYAAQKLGVVKQTHLELFRQKFEERYPMNTLDELGSFYAREGVDKAKFLQIAHSAETTQALERANALTRYWGVDATPTIVVDGKYRSNQIKSYQQLIDMTQWLVQRELKSGS